MMPPSPRLARTDSLWLPHSAGGTEIVAPLGERQGAVDNGWNCRFTRLKYKVARDFAITPRRIPDVTLLCGAAADLALHAAVEAGDIHDHALMGAIADRFQIVARLDSEG